MGAFHSKLEPAQKETWTAVITGPDAKKAVAEMVAALYDESLDAYFPHHWMQHFDVFYQDDSIAQLTVRECAEMSCSISGAWLARREQGRHDDLSLLPGRHHRQSLGLPVLSGRIRRDGQARIGPCKSGMAGRDGIG